MKDGFKNAESAFAGLRTYYQDLQKSDVVAIVRYEVFKVSNTPTVSTNEHN